MAGQRRRRWSAIGPALVQRNPSRTGATPLSRRHRPLPLVTSGNCHVAAALTSRSISALHSQKVVSSHLQTKQIPHSGFARRNMCIYLPRDYRTHASVTLKGRERACPRGTLDWARITNHLAGGHCIIPAAVAGSRESIRIAVLWCAPARITPATVQDLGLL